MSKATLGMWRPARPCIGWVCAGTVGPQYAFLVQRYHFLGLDSLDDRNSNVMEVNYSLSLQHIIFLAKTTPWGPNRTGTNSQRPGHTHIGL